MVAQFHKLPDYLRYAFREAVWRFDDWQPDQPEPHVNVERSDHSMSTICALLLECHDCLPNEIFYRLFLCMKSSPRYRFLKDKLTLERTYAAGAYCLLMLIDERKDRSS